MSSKIATNIRYFRELNDWTQLQLAKKLNVSRSNITKWENESAIPDLNTLIKISNLFSISLDQLVGKSLSDDFLLKEFERVYSLDTEDERDQQEIIKAIDLLKKNKTLLHDLTKLSQLPVRKQKSVINILKSIIQEMNRV
ncbi:helix-turn-helix transcriptional regulator [Piscibacillus halophilus]|uniref:DNA-binding transcriptional regulator, XRE-family HTH domain n=1 Tax=Piscibacillus halophilus TaxID=571933 RepID=A0A1H9GFS8_9BACI|nr:helix-turn-helix transcriptional regulator [Piscibacillus halophilus]SEQ48907.1 DNA-binding transcriptional regulator, XRE-family HTH domain [Piscibacillus halophilus]